MFSLKNLTQKLRLLNNISFKPNLAPKLKPSFNKRLFSSSILSKKCIKNINKSQYAFSTSRPEFSCGKVTDIYNELMETVNNNIKDIIAILPGKGINVSSFCLNRFAKLCYTKEPALFEILYKNIENEIEDAREQNTLLSVVEGLYWAKQLEGKLPKVPESVLERVSRQILELRPLIKDEVFQNIKKMLAVFPAESSESLDQLLHANPNQLFSIEECVEAIEETDNYNQIKDVFEITKIDISNSHVQIRFIEADQTVDIFACEPHPNNSVKSIISFLKENTKEVNLLLVEDSAVFLQPDNDYEFKDDQMLEASETLRKDAELVNILEKQELEHYVQVFMHDENLFDYNEDEQTVYTKVNLKAKAPSELGTTTLHFFLNADRERGDPKIVLLDLTLQEIIGKMSTDFTLDQLRGLLDLLNYCTLIEKAYYADVCQVNGCFLCRESSASKMPLPKDMISIVAGDKELPMDYRTTFLARSMLDALEKNPTYKKTMMLTGSFHLFDIIKELIGMVRDHKEGNQEYFNRIEHFGELVLDFDREGESREQSMEKLALLETVYQAVEVSSLDNIDPNKATIDFKKYLQKLHEYGYQLSYEKLTQNNQEIKIQPGECGAETLIFGAVTVEEEFAEPDLEKEKALGYKKMEMEGLFSTGKEETEEKEEEPMKIKLKSNVSDPKKK